MPGDTGRDKGKGDGGDGGAHDSGDDRGNDTGGYGGDDEGGFSDPVTGRELSRADAEAYDRAFGGGGDVASAMMGLNAAPLGYATGIGELSPGTLGRMAANMGIGGMSDIGASQTMANMGVGYMDRASLLGPLDAIATNPTTSAISRIANLALGIANPALGMASTLGDVGLNMAVTGSPQRAVSLGAGILGSRLGGMMGGDISNSMAGAQLGGMLGGQLGRGLGAAIGQGGGVGQGDNFGQGDGGAGQMSTSSPTLSSRQSQAPSLMAQQLLPLLVMSQLYNQGQGGYAGAGQTSSLNLTNLLDAVRS